jgi:hypothetical protein
MIVSRAISAAFARSVASLRSLINASRVCLEVSGHKTQSNTAFMVLLDDGKSEETEWHFDATYDFRHCR